MHPSAPPLEQARACLRANDHRQAEQLCRQALQQDAGHADAWHLLGTALGGQGRHADALEAFRRAVALRPAWADGYRAQAAALRQLGQADEALAALDRAVRLRPDDAEARADLGLELGQCGRTDEAIDHLGEAVRLRPDYAVAWYNLGVALSRRGRRREAADALGQALRAWPDYVEALHTLGTVLGELGRRDEAIDLYRRALALRPDRAAAYSDLGLALSRAGRHEEAVVLLRQALRLAPRMREAANNLGLALAELGRFDQAEAAYHEALRLDPSYVEAHSNLGNAVKEQGRFEEALACYQVALWLEPQSVSTRYNRSLTLLQMGDYARGWPEYEWRWRRPSAPPPRPYTRPAWDGADPGGKTLLLWCEQGLGDAIQFARYAAPVRALGAKVVLECPGCLVGLLSTCPGVDQVIAEGQPLPDYDAHVSLMSLPALLKTTLETVPAAVPYLSPEPARVEAWRQRLGPPGGFRVGVVWQGNPRHQWDRHRSFPLAALEPLAAVEGVRLISLQKGPGAEQLRGLNGRFAVADLGGQLDTEGGAFLDTAAVLANLDLVVTADTAAAHVAGALGVPVWLAVAAIADWRWLRGREDTPWYPTMRLFRQAAVGDWAGVFARMAGELRRLVERQGRRGLVEVAMSAGEALDKLTILGIKAGRLTDPDKLAQVRAELAALQAAWDRAVPATEELNVLRGELRSVNEALWRVEDELRRCERDGDFGPGFVELARSVYRHNDARAALKRRLNDLLGAPFGEQKEYAAGTRS